MAILTVRAASDVDPLALEVRDFQQGDFAHFVRDAFRRGAVQGYPTLKGG